MTRIRELAAATPAWRDRYVDLLRALAITAVVLGHWLIMTVGYDQRGGITGTSALAELTWAHPVSWLFQVMPVFFMVGGYANAISLGRYRQRGGRDSDWLLGRSARLIRPTTMLLLVLAAGAVLAGLLGADPAQVGRAVWLASLPLWFLVVYLLMVVLTPVMYRLHQRAGLAVPVLLLVPVVAGDGLRLWSGQEPMAYGNFLFAWLAIHQIGFGWADGRLPDRARVSVPLLLAGFGGLVLLTVAGPYPVSVVTVPGAGMQNSSPPSLALVSLAAAQLGLAMLARPAAQRWLRRTRPWTAVVSLNAVILTVFLWHMSAAVLGTLLLHLAGRLPFPPVGTAGWWLGRVPWVALLTVLLAGLVLLLGRIEVRAAAGAGGLGRPVPGWVAGRIAAGQDWLVPAGYGAVVVGLLWQAVAGSGHHGPFGFPTGALLLYLAGAAVLRVGTAAGLACGIEAK
ncbi:MAG: acyltransferase family protein, partial [Natronosporangium sp.]